MFDRSTLDELKDEELTHWKMVNYYPGLHYTVYPQHAFHPPDGEESIRVTRAPKHPQDSGIRFWLSAEWTADCSGRESYFAGYARGAAFEPISEEEFNRLISASCSTLIVPIALPLPPQSGFVGALLMYSMKTEFTVSLFAEYQNEFIHFHWETTA